MHPLFEQTFNNDILVSEEDRALARVSFPKLGRLLDFPELREIFLEYDRMSNQAKRSRRNAGITAIALAFVALVGISAEPLYVGMGECVARILAGLCAFAGIAGVGFGIVEMRKKNLKQQWLSGRLVTERLRQFQFQVFVLKTKSIISAMADDSAEAFILARHSWFSEFWLSFQGQTLGQLAEVLHDDANSLVFLLEEEAFDPTILESPEATELFSAYRRLRFGHQLQYASYKQKDDGVKSPSVQRILLRHILLYSIAAVFMVHLLIALWFVIGWPEWANGVTSHVLVLWACIIALTGRAIEEGLQPVRELDRYFRYHTQADILLAQFDKAATGGQKLLVMREMEKVVYEEMRTFLRVHDEAGFSL